MGKKKEETSPSAPVSAGPSSRVELALAAIHKKFGKEAALLLDSRPSEPVPVIPTGSFGLDQALGVGGYPKGRVIEAWGPEGCLDETTRVCYAVHTADGHRISHKGGTIRRLHERFHGLTPSGDGRGKYVREGVVDAVFTAPSMNEEGRIIHNRVLDVVEIGMRPCLVLTMRTGQRIMATSEHKFWTGERFVSLGDVVPGSTLYIHNRTPYRVADDAAAGRCDRAYLYVKHHPFAGVKVVRPSSGGVYEYRRLLRSRAVVEAGMNGLSLDEYVVRLNNGVLDGLVFLTADEHVHHRDEDVTNDSRDNLVVLSAAEHSRVHALKCHNNLRFAAIPAEVEDVREIGVRMVFDARMAGPYNNYVANGLVVHNSGKSTMALQAVAEAQRMGVVCAYVDAEHALSVAYAQALKIKTGELILSQPDYGEQGLEIVETLISSGAVGLVVVDSVAALVPKAEIEGEMGNHQMGAHARLMSQALRKLTALVHRRNAIVIFINQIRMKIGAYGNPETTTGGNALKFYASVRLEVRRLTVVKAGENVIGSRVRVKVLKNKVAPPFKEAEFEIIFGQGIRRDREVIDLALRYGVIQQAGSWFSVDGERVGHGREALVQWFGANPTHALKIEAKVKDLFTKVPPPVQETPAEPESATDENPVTFDPDEADVPI